MDKTPSTNILHSESSLSPNAAQQGISVNDVPFEWDLERGSLKCFGIESAVFWKDPSLLFMFRPLVEEAGIDLFRLIVASSSSEGAEEDYKAITQKDFKTGFAEWAALVSTAGWGRFHLIEYEPGGCHAVIRVDNPWELALQLELPEDKRWGCPFLQGKIIGIFEQVMGQTCWASETCDYVKEGDSSVTFTVYASDKTIENELASLRQAKLTQHEQQLQAEIDAKTKELQKSNEILENVAQLDFLTNLNNRRSLENKLSSLIEIDTWGQYTLLFVDLDQFKVINDTCGHLSGDRLLTIVGEQLIACVGREDHCTYRYGGDEFTVLLNTPDTEYALNLAHNIRHAIGNIRFDWEGRIYQINCSIGLISLAYIEPAVDKAIIAADNACYQAKIKGRNQVHVAQELDYQVENRLLQMNWVHRIKEAVANDNFEMHFQVIKPLNNSETIALEALIRMVDNQDNSLIMPFNFLPAAEHYDVIYDVDCWVIEHVFQKLQALGQNDYLESIAINLSGNTLSNPNLEGFISRCFEEYQIDPRKICFEITETHMMMNLETAKGLLSKLRKHGCTISLDDFGAGMSSFGYLRSLPIDKIKIDGGFVKNMHESMVDFTFVESIANVARAMKIKTVAEFVENERIVELLEDMMVDYAQGYHIAKPQRWDEIFP